MSTFIDLLEKITEAYHKKLPFVAYKKPDALTVSAIFQEDDLLHHVKDYTEQGFVFAPFDDAAAAVLIPNDTKIQVPFDRVEVSKNQVFVLSDEKEINKEKHVEFVKKTILHLKETAVSKIVIARPKDISCTSFELTIVFQKLLSNYPKATAYVWYHPKVGLWMGATPEMLLEINKDTFKTMSLAGTQTFVDTVDVIWGEKEIEEQQLVTDYVVSNLKEETKTVAFSKTYTVKAGSLLHLRTDISGTISEKKGVAYLLKVLHPTPAVCGFPRAKSKKFILENENFVRSFYTGFFGELNIENKTSLYVNLRCLEKRAENTIRLYVGGGITQKSNPLKEWEETVAKCKTMESVL